MSNEQSIQSLGNVTVWWVPTAGIANPNSPTAAEINAGTNISSSISWNSFAVGFAQSALVDDRSIVDTALAQSRGFGNYAATLDFFYPAVVGDTSNVFNTTYALYKSGRVPGYLIVRAGQRLPTVAATAGDFIDVYGFTSDLVIDSIPTDQSSAKYQVKFIPSGIGYPFAMVYSATTMTITASTATISTSAKLAKLVVTLLGHDLGASATYSSSDVTKATVSSTGVVTWVAAGSPTITVSHPAATTTATQAITCS